MKTILFINGCIRGENSRTLKIARTYIKKHYSSDNYKIIEKNLNEEDLAFMTKASFDPVTGEPLPSSTALAEEFAQADQIILAAPFWEFMFPAVVNCYFEKVSVVGIAFEYTETGSVGLCKADSFKYIYTSGDYLGEDDKISEKYLKRLTELYGIKNFSSILVDALDIETNDAVKLVNDMCDKL